MTEECSNSAFTCSYDDIGDFERDFIGLTTEVRKLLQSCSLWIVDNLILKHSFSRYLEIVDAEAILL